MEKEQKGMDGSCRGVDGDGEASNSVPAYLTGSNVSTREQKEMLALTRFFPYIKSVYNSLHILNLVQK